MLQSDVSALNGQMAQYMIRYCCGDEELMHSNGMSEAEIRKAKAAWEKVLAEYNSVYNSLKGVEAYEIAQDGGEIAGQDTQTLALSSEGRPGDTNTAQDTAVSAAETSQNTAAEVMAHSDSDMQSATSNELRSDQEQPTVHSLLMETDASKVKNAIERKYLKEYQETATRQLAEQQKLDKLQAELDALSKDNRQTYRARFLRDELIKTKNRLQICQSIQTRLETDSPLTYLIHREVKPAQSAHNAVRNTGKVVQYSSTADFSVNIPGKSREFNEGVSRACARVAKLGSIDGKEHLLLLDAKNCSCVYEETGDMNSVGGEAYREFMASHRENEYIFVHDHTTDGYFSEIDMLSLLTTDNLRAFVAVRLDGIIYYVERKGESVKLGFPDKIYADALKPLTEKVRNGIITMGERTRLREEIIVDHLIQDYTEGLMEFDGRK